MQALILVALALPCLPARAGVESDLEQGIGDFLAQVFIAQRGQLSQPPLDSWIAGLGAELVACTPRQDLNYRFLVLDSPESNAFALPGGWVFVTAGLLESAGGDDEIAAVMAHELAHLVDRDFQRVTARTLMWLGLGELAHRSDRDDLVPLVQAAQLVNTLRHSRRQEAQADEVGARIAWRAGYDPATLADFLGSAPAWSYLETVFATHPHPERRGTWIRAHVAELRAQDPAGALALARGLMARCRYTAARALLTDVAAPPSADATIAAERAALLARIEEVVAARVTETGDATVLPDEAVAGPAAARAAMDAALEGAEEARGLAWRRLRALRDDRMVRDATLLANALDPELTDPAYLTLLAQAANLLHRSVRGGNLVARTLSMRSSAVSDLRALCAELEATRVPAPDRPVLTDTASDATVRARMIAEDAGPDTAALAGLAAEYLHCARLAAPLLAELASTGEGKALGRLTFGRYLVLQAQVTNLARRLDGHDRQADELAARAWGHANAAVRLRLNRAGVLVAPSVRPLLLRNLARRTQSSAGRLKSRWHTEGGLGDALLAELDDALIGSDEIFGSRLRAMQIAIRLSFRDTEELLFTGVKEGAPQEEPNRALGDTVGHPQ